MTATRRDERRRWLALFVVCFGGDVRARHDHRERRTAVDPCGSRLSEASLVWVLNAYMLTFCAFLLLGGRLCDLHGHRRMFMPGLVLSTAASLTCGLATTQWLLVIARAVQGLGGVVVDPIALSLIVNLFDDRRPHRRAARRLADAGAELALDIPRQRAARHRRVDPLQEAAAGCQRATGRSEARRRRRHHGDGRVAAGGVFGRRIVNTAFMMCGALGLALLAILAAARTDAALAGGAVEAVALTAGYRVAFGIGAVFAAVAAATAWLAIRGSVPSRTTALR
ncbi:MAG: MFS transporter [Burkholderiaceae bacterium]